MSDYNPSNSGDLSAQTLTSGVALANNASLGAGPIGVTLGVGTYVFALGSGHAPAPTQTALCSVHIAWAALVAATITVEVCNFPQTLNDQGNGGTDTADYDSGNTWQQWNPTLAGPLNVQVAGTNNTTTAFTITAGGTNAGTVAINLQDIGFHRIRIKVVTTVGGVMRVNAHSKVGA